MVTMAFTVETSESAISALKMPATPAPNSFEAARAPTATTPFISPSGVA